LVQAVYQKFLFWYNQLVMIKTQIIYSSGTDWTFNLARAQGSYIWDSEGNKYLDFTSEAIIPGFTL